MEAGIQPGPALKTLNTAAMLRCQGGAGFTTIDLACLDRAEGVLTLYKYGAAPSYIKRQGAVARYRAQALPAGLESADGDAAQTYANVIACRKGDENSAKIQALVKALQSDAVKEYIEKTYNGAVVAIF